MVSSFEQRCKYVVERLRQIPGIKLAQPQVTVGVCVCVGGGAVCVSEWGEGSQAYHTYS